MLDYRCAHTLKLGATEILNDILPIRRVIKSSQVGLQLSAQDLESGTLANTVGSNQTQNISRPRHRETMQFEAVGRISVRDLTLEVGGKVDDRDSAEGATLGADTASDTQLLRDECQTRLGGHLACAPYC